MITRDQSGLSEVSTERQPRQATQLYLPAGWRGSTMVPGNYFWTGRRERACGRGCCPCQATPNGPRDSVHHTRVLIFLLTLSSFILKFLFSQLPVPYTVKIRELVPWVKGLGLSWISWTQVGERAKLPQQCVCPLAACMHTNINKGM